MVRKFWPLIALICGLVFGWIITPTEDHAANEPLADAATLTRLTLGDRIDTPQDFRFADFHGIQATPPSPETLEDASSVLGTTSGSDKRIEVDLTSQRVYAFDGNAKVYTFVVSTGKWGRTPTGEFTIWTKVRSQLMKGGSRELHTYYYLPNVPYVMFFYNNQIAKMRGFSFHGTYWHNNFGHPMSHGCINMRTEDAKTLYEWATPVVTNPRAWSTPATAENPGTKVIIYGVTPKE